MLFTCFTLVGSTTVGLFPDDDVLYCHTFVEVTSYDEVLNSNKILCQAKKTRFSGYRYITFPKGESSLSNAKTSDLENTFDKNNLSIINGEIYLLNSYLLNVAFKEYARHGPARRIKEDFGERDQDFVQAFFCRQVPSEVGEFIIRTKEKPWPTEDLKTFVKDSGYFLVPVCHKESTDHSLEYRVCTPFAERKFCHSMSITQTRCLIILKMLIKTHVNSEFLETIKSFFCKTALFYVVEESGNQGWTEESFVEFVVKCLKWLEISLRNNDMPHYFMPSLNMLENRFTEEKRNSIANRLLDLISDPVKFISEIKYDSLGQRLTRKLDEVLDQTKTTYNENHDNLYKIGEFLLEAYLKYRRYLPIKVLKPKLCDKPEKSLNDVLSDLKACIEECKRCEEEFNCFAVKVLKAYIYSLLGAALAGLEIQSRRCISPETEMYLKAGIHSDISSGRLRYASVLCKTEQYSETLDILKEVEKHCLEDNVAIVCGCETVRMRDFPEEFCKRWKYMLKDDKVEDFTSFCVVFFYTDLHIIPEEFKKLLKPPNEPIKEMVSVDAIAYLLGLKFLTHIKLCKIKDAKSALGQLKGFLGSNKLYHTPSAKMLYDVCSSILDKGLLLYKRQADSTQ